MANCKVIPVNAVDTATLASSPSALTTMPLDNLKLWARDRVMRSPLIAPTSTFVITGSWGGDLKAISAWGLFRHNGLGAKAQLQLYLEPALSTLLYDSSAQDIYDSIPAWGSFNWGEVPWGSPVNDPLATEAPFLKFLSSTYYAGGFRLTISQPVNYFEMSRFVLGEALEAPYNPEYGFKLGTASATERRRTRGGSRRNLSGARWKTMIFNLFQATDADRARWLDLFAMCDLTDFVICVFPSATGRQYRDYIINGGFANLGDSTIENYNFFRQPIQIEEN